jgi:hypothetical protein
LLISTSSPAGTLTGIVTYGRETVASTFPGFAFGTAAAFNTGTSEWVFGSADPLTGTYIIDGLATGSWHLRVLFGPSAFGGRISAASGELIGSESGVEVTVGLAKTVDLEARFVYRITQPFDSLGKWPGSFQVCPQGGGAPRLFALS